MVVLYRSNGDEAGQIRFSDVSLALLTKCGGYFEIYGLKVPVGLRVAKADFAKAKKAEGGK